MRRALGLLMQAAAAQQLTGSRRSNSSKIHLQQGPYTEACVRTHTHGCHGNTQLSSASDHTPVNRQIHTNEVIY